MPREHDESTSSASPAGISVEHVRRLIQVMDASDVHEVTIERENEGLKLTLRKPTPVIGGAPLVMTSGSNGSQPLAAPFEAEAEGTEVDAQDTESETYQKVTATLVGLFRASLKRGSKAAVAVGDAVREEQDVGAIEALNVMNEVKTPVAGRVVEIVVKDGQPVEYGQHLMTIDTGAS